MSHILLHYIVPTRASNLSSPPATPSRTRPESVLLKKENARDTYAGALPASLVSSHFVRLSRFGSYVLLFAFSADWLAGWTKQSGQNLARPFCD